ncbi:uncharacterized protein [Rutidosis leptorrhynchoides]|uniref:uncharacterized protein n=1 Tax=Rutidosis leptorrhynchoides TaxID=125765 RepID=UPI003A9A2442
MDPQSLKLVFLKGPREGESVEFRFGATVRVGRVVRGNNLPIKAAGISTKHLVIESVRESNKWILTDLESSNDTVLNNVKLSPLTAVELNDGDKLEIGANARNASVEVQAEAENAAKLDRIDDLRPRRYLTRQWKMENHVAEVKNATTLDEDNGRRELRSQRNPTRRGKAKNPVVEAEISKGLDGGEESSLQQSPEKKVGIDDSTIYPETGNGEVQKRKRGMPPERGSRRGRVGNSKWKERDEVVELVNISENDDLNVGVHEEGFEKGVEQVNEEHGAVRIDSSGREPQNEDRLEKENVNVEEVIGVSDSKETENADVIGDSHVDTVMDRDEEEVVAREEKTDGGDDQPEVGKEFDLERATVGEWLDYLEVMLPKQIREKTDKMIEEMRAKANRTKKYMVEQKRKKEMVKCS